MSNRRSLKDLIRKRQANNGCNLSVRRLLAFAGLGLSLVVLVAVMLTVIFGSRILNGYGKKKVERAFAKALPGYALQIGELGYAVLANRLVADSVTLSATNSTLKVGRISLKGVRWVRLLWGTALVNVLTRASLEATDLDMDFPRSNYGIHCAKLRGSVPDSELTAQGTELRLSGADEKFFAAHDFRATRLHVIVPECRVSGLAYGDLFQGKGYRARSAHLSRLSLDALVNRDKPVKPFVKSPFMLPEALAAIRKPLQVDSLSITNGHLKYCERVVAGADPGVLTITAVYMVVEGIANRSEVSSTINLRAQGNLMNAGVMKMQMTIPLASPDFSYHYSGSLGAMDLTLLNEFLEVAEHLRIKSGSTQETSFDIKVTAGQAQGYVRTIYKDLTIAVRDKLTGSEKGFGNRVTSFLANLFKIKNANARDAAGVMKEGEVSYSRKPNDHFLKYTWFALRSGVLDAISH